MCAKIAVVGSFNADLVTYVQHLPRSGETLHAQRFITGAGGKGSNQAVGAARLGAHTTLIARVGSDSFAEIGFNLWRDVNIHTEAVIRDAEQPTGMAMIAVDEVGSNTIIVIAGANYALTPADVDARANVIRESQVLLTQLEVTPAATTQALKLAKQHHVKTILNPAPAYPLPEDMLAHVDYLTPNETELQTLCGSSSMSVEEAARSLIKFDYQTVVVTLGEQGAQYITKHNSHIVPAFHVTPVDTVGAGDAFNAGLAVALAEGQALAEAIRFANATAAVSITRQGAAASMPSREEVMALLNA
ncbi:MAG: ribokinase [Anaerolineae bacterium]